MVTAEELIDELNITEEQLYIEMDKLNMRKIYSVQAKIIMSDQNAEDIRQEILNNK